MEEREKNYARELLSGLDEKDILELAKTVTKAKFNPKNKQEGIEYIVRYEIDARSLLSRKKISSSLLSQYLHAKNIPFNIDSSKLSLCDSVQQYWNTSLLAINSGNALPYENRNSITHPNCLPVNNAATQDNVLPLMDRNITRHPEYLPLSDRVSQGDNAVSTVDSLSVTNGNCQAVELSDSDISNLGHQFVEWFFSQFGGPDLILKEMGHEHFFSDASCRVHIETELREGNGGETCAGVLNESLRLIGGAVPIPNLGGVRSQSSPHGAIKILACGTLHAPPTRMLGAFEQAFLLIRDPSMQDNWKIKYTELRLKAQSSDREIDATAQASIEYQGTS